MNRVGAIVCSLILAACLVPFTNTRQAAGALAPFVPLAPAAPASEEPRGEDDARETDAKERLTAQAKHRPPVRELIGTLPPAHAAHLPFTSRVRATPPVAVDPFRNGLGTPYRC